MAFWVFFRGCLCVFHPVHTSRVQHASQHTCKIEYSHYLLLLLLLHCVNTPTDTVLMTLRYLRRCITRPVLVGGQGYTIGGGVSEFVPAPPSPSEIAVLVYSHWLFSSTNQRACLSAGSVDPEEDGGDHAARGLLQRPQGSRQQTVSRVSLRIKREPKRVRFKFFSKCAVDRS